MKIVLTLRSIEIDAGRVNKAYLKAERQVLMRAAARGRGIAKRAMRKRKRASRPGEAPSVRKGQLKKFILFAFDAPKHVALFGPKKLPGSKDTPEVLEKGLIASRRVGRGRNRRNKSIRFAKRPAMVPALDQIMPGLPAMWKNAIR